MLAALGRREAEAARPAMSWHPRGGDERVEERAAGRGERIDDLAVAAGVGQPSGSQRAEVMADEVFCLGGDPSQVANAQLAALAQCQRDRHRRSEDGSISSGEIAGEVEAEGVRAL